MCHNLLFFILVCSTYLLLFQQRSDKLEHHSVGMKSTCDSIINFIGFLTAHDILKEGGIVSSLSFLTDDMEIHLQVQLHLLKFWEKFFDCKRGHCVVKCH